MLEKTILQALDIQRNMSGESPSPLHSHLTSVQAHIFKMRKRGGAAEAIRTSLQRSPRDGLSSIKKHIS